jgi:FkbM family methyltransferase
MKPRTIKYVRKALRLLHMDQQVAIVAQVMFGNVSYRIPILGRIGMQLLSDDEVWLSEWLCGELSDGEVVWDVGANVGQTLLKVLSLGKSPKYFGFEPNISCLEYLNYLCAVNDIDNVTLVPAGISSNTGIAVLNLYAGLHDAMGTIRNDIRASLKVSSRMYVNTINGNEIARMIAEKIVLSPTLIKIDVEGSEHVVVLEILNALDQLPERIIFEVLPSHSEDELVELDQRVSSLELCFGQYGYHIYKLMIKNGRLVKEQGVDQISRTIYDSEIDMSDSYYVARRFGKHHGAL